MDDVVCFGCFCWLGLCMVVIWGFETWARFGV